MKKAVCIGINYAGTDHELRGCINDADDWSRLLGTNGFQVGVLAEKQATKGAIVQAVRLMINNMQPGDVSFVTYSGHGTWVPDQDGDEPDGRDEAVCPIDMGDDGANLIIDDEFRALFDNVPTGSHLVFVTDSCHSGTVYRMLAPGGSKPRVRFLPPSHFLRSTKLVARMDRAFGQVVKANKPSAGVIHFSGCKDYEYSNDAVIDGRACGAFSYFATRAFAAAAGTGASYHDAWCEVRKSLPSWDYQQTPLLNAPTPLKKIKVFG